MAKDEFTREQLEQAPSLRGSFTRKDQPITELERAVARHQGLLEDDGTLKSEALEKVLPPLPSNMPQTIPLEELVPEKAAGIEAAIQAAKGEHAPDAVEDVEKQVETGLAPPPFDDTELSAGPGEPPGDNQSAAAAVDLRQLIRGAKEPLYCGYCGWDQRDSFKPPPFTEEDKLAFIRHVMSKSGRFFKRFTLLGGKVKVTLRSRSQAELEAIMECARQELKAEELTGIGDLQAQLQRYHIAASVCKIVDQETPEDSQEFAPLDVQLDKLNTAAKAAVQAKDKAVFGAGQSTGMYTIITTRWMEFERLYGYFASRAHDPDFWTAAAGDHS